MYSLLEFFTAFHRSDTFCVVRQQEFDAETILLWLSAVNPTLLAVSIRRKSSGLFLLLALAEKQFYLLLAIRLDIELRGMGEVLPLRFLEPLKTPEDRYVKGTAEISSQKILAIKATKRLLKYLAITAVHCIGLVFIKIEVWSKHTDEVFCCF